MKQNIYRSFLNTGLRMFMLTFVLFTGRAYSQTTYTFFYTGATQTISLPAGNYSIECWGADGGSATNGTNLILGGKGGYARGVYANATTATFNVYVGGHGGNASGGAQVGGGGGGMSDIAPASNHTAVIIAAGGGGGGTSGGTTNENSVGGDGGGLTGGTAIDGTGVSGGTAASGGSQTAGGFATAGSFGVGTPGGYGYGGGAANGGTAGVMHSAGGAGGNGAIGGWNGGGGGSSLTGINDHSGGGGAGYYGGGGGRGDGGAGGGGSSYIGGVTSGTTIMFGQPGFVTNPDASANGRVLITELCSMNLTAAGASSSVAPVICAGVNLTLTTDAVSNYSWSTGVTGTNQIIVSPTSNTVYAITATSSLACQATRSIFVTVSSGPPQLTLSVSSNSVCMGDSVVINAFGAYSYTYSGGISPGTYFYPTQTTTYSVTGQNACGITTASTTVTVSTLPVFAAANPATVCAGTSATLSGAGANSFTWEPNSVPGQSIVVAPSSTTIYTVTGQIGGCMGQATVQVDTKATPTLNINATAATICEGDSVTMQVSGASSYVWTTNPPTGTLTGNVIVGKPTDPIAYNVTGTNSLGCLGFAQHIVIVNAKPNVKAFANPTLICVGASAALNASGANSYTWTGFPSGQTATVSPVQTTTYVVTGTENVHHCTAAASIVVNVFQATVNTTPNTAICPGTSLVISSGTVTQTVTPTAKTIYTLQTFTQVGSQKCPVTSTIEVDLFPAPSVTASSSQSVVCRNEKVVFTASGAHTYKWNTNNANASFTVTALTTNPFNYTVTGTDTNGCKATDKITVNVSNCKALAENTQEIIRVYPNPNSGSFVIETEEPLEITIFNELGQVVKRLAPTGGVIQVQDLAKGVYVLHARNEYTNLKKTVVIE